MSYIIEKCFLDESLCKSMIEYFEYNIGKKEYTNINKYFNNRIIYWNDIKGNLKELVKTKVLQIMEKIKVKYNILYELYVDSIHIVKWNKGQSLGEHADAFYADGSPNYTPWRKYS